MGQNINSNCYRTRNNCEESTLKHSCSFQNVSPAILPFSFPEIQVQCQNKYYANLLSHDYCGSDSELTAIMQYVNHEIRLSDEECTAAQIILAICQAEMIHLQKLGELIVLLGGKLKFNAYDKHCAKMWTPEPIVYGNCFEEIIRSDIKGEKAAIAQYENHIEKIDDPYVTAMLERIVMDEKYHLSLLNNLLK